MLEISQPPGDVAWAPVQVMTVFGGWTIQLWKLIPSSLCCLNFFCFLLWKTSHFFSLLPLPNPSPIFFFLLPSPSTTSPPPHARVTPPPRRFNPNNNNLPRRKNWVAARQHLRWWPCETSNLRHPNSPNLKPVPLYDKAFGYSPCTSP